MGIATSKTHRWQKSTSSNGSHQEDAKNTVTIDSKNGVKLRGQKSERRRGRSTGSRFSSDSRQSKHTSFYEMVDASELNSYLLVGNQACIENEEFLNRKLIHYVLNLSNLALPSIKEGVHYKCVPLEDEDDENILGILDDCLSFLHDAKKKCVQNKTRILIYSYFGISRSCSVAIAHLMKEENWNLQKTWITLKQYHPLAKPNDGFLLQLLQYEVKLHGSMSMNIQDFYSR